MNPKSPTSYPTIKYQFNKVRVCLQKLAFSDYSATIKVNKSNASTEYIHKSHMSAVAYTYMFHRQISIIPKL